MRIPADALTHYLTESDAPPSNDGARAEPVDAASNLQSSLPDPHEKQRYLAENQAHPQRTHRLEERRKLERRQRDLPVLLDTRIGRRRHDAERYPQIDYAI